MALDLMNALKPEDLERLMAMLGDPDFRLFPGLTQDSFFDYMTSNVAARENPAFCLVKHKGQTVAWGAMSCPTDWSRSGDSGRALLPVPGRHRKPTARAVCVMLGVITKGEFVRRYGRDAWARVPRKHRHKEGRKQFVGLEYVADMEG